MAEAVTLSTGVEIPAEGVPMNGGDHQYTTRVEKRPVAITNEAQYLKWKWRMNLADPKSGLDNAGLCAGVRKIADASGWRAGREDWYEVSARIFDYLVDNVQIGFSKYDCFPAISAWDRHARPSSAILWSHAAEVDGKHSPGLRAEIDKLHREGCAAIFKDFDHSAPDWDFVFKVGFPGMKARADAVAKDSPFYRAEKRAAAAMMRFLNRLVETAKAHPDAGSPMLKMEIESLERLRLGPPKTCFDLMEFTMIYFILSEPLNYFQVRTMGNIDRLWLPYYERDVAEGRTTEVEFREQFRHFIWQFGSIDNYWGHPIYLGGVNLDGRSAYNALSPIMLDVVDKEALPTPKFQLKFGPDTPDAIWNQALDMLRRHRSLVLMSEPNMMESMKAVDLPVEDAKDLLVWGCFEYLPRGRGNCTQAAYINMPNPVVQMLAESAAGSRPSDFPTFSAFKREYVRILTNNVVQVVSMIDENERHLAECNPALMLSLAVPSALERGVDAFSLGYDYNYSAVGMNGIGTAIDSLLAVKEFVYDRQDVSLAELGKALRVDWKGYEDLQLKAKRSLFKWGCGNPVADALAKEVVEVFTGSFVGRPNVRGGKYVCYGLTSRGFVSEAPYIGATPDGRSKADHLSKNIAPSIGAETEGVSGSIKSESALGPKNFPCGAVYDVVIHPSLVSGDKGLSAFRAIVEQYFDGGGIAMNVNIVSPELLREAQRHPERFENLQVRVAGWNVRWNDIPKKEQDEYIRRAEGVSAVVVPIRTPDSDTCNSGRQNLIPMPRKRVGADGFSSVTNIRCVVDADLPAEGYRLVVSPSEVTIASHDAAGAFYARQTIRQLGDPLPCGTIEDWPSFRWRGLMLDEGRHFFGKEVVKRCLDRMAEYKLNVFHWHLTEDQGWRIALDRFPELARYGAVRPDVVAHGSRGLPSRGDCVLTGMRYGPYFYTASDISEILDYAKERHIVVVPEVELPGHLQALLAAHPEFSCRGDVPRMPRVNYDISDEVLCVGNDRAVAFMEQVYDEIVKMFPGTYVHIGGDECPRVRWKNCAKCQKRMRDLGLKDEEALQGWVTRHFTDYLAKKGRRAIGWDEVLAGEPSAETVIQCWRDAKFASAAAMKGHNVIVSPVLETYFSVSQGVSDGDPYTYLSPELTLPLEKVYRFDPLRGIDDSVKAHVLGAECCLWSECIWNLYDLEWKLLPRLCAFAEALWSAPLAPRDTDDFLRRMNIHRRRLIDRGINCAPLR